MQAVQLLDRVKEDQRIFWYESLFCNAAFAVNELRARWLRR
jgi:hypothetical protein